MPLFGKSILQVPDTSTRVLDNTRPFLCSSIVSFRITLACSKERKYHIFGQYWYTKNVPVLTKTGTFQYLGPEVYFFPLFFSFFFLTTQIKKYFLHSKCTFPIGSSISVGILFTVTYYSHFQVVYSDEVVVQGKKVEISNSFWRHLYHNSMLCIKAHH